MSLSALPTTVEARPARLLALPRVARTERDASRTLAGVRCARQWRHEIARAAHDALESLVGVDRRSALVLASEAGCHRLEPDEVALEDTALAPGGAGFELRRGRSCVRVVRSGNETVFRNGWALARGVPASLRDGDTVESRGGAFRVAYEPALPRPLVEVGPARAGERPAAAAFEWQFALEPAGQPLVVACDAAAARAVLDVVAGGDGNRPFDPTALADVERAIVDWTLHRAAHATLRALAGDSVALRFEGRESRGSEVWLGAAVRVGSFTSVWWLGTTEGAIAALDALVSPRIRRPLAAVPVAALLDVEVVARIELGRLTPAELAGLEPGDLLVAGDLARFDGSGVRGPAYLDLGAPGRASVAVSVEQFGPTVRAVLGRDLLYERSSAMESQSASSGAQPLDDRPFERALEELHVVVSVEIARRRVQLARLLLLEPGDVVELDAEISTSVVLTVDGRPIARGELVDSDGMLGVRIAALGGSR